MGGIPPIPPDEGFQHFSGLPDALDVGLKQLYPDRRVFPSRQRQRPANAVRFDQTIIQDIDRSQSRPTEGITRWV